MASFRVFCGILLLLVASCGDKRPSLTQLAEATAPHLQAHSRFAAWAMRAQLSSASANAREALIDATFAPVRHDRTVLFAKVIATRGTHKHTLHFPADAELSIDVVWQRIRGQEQELSAAVAARCPLNAPSWWRDGAAQGPCVLLSSKSHFGAGDALTVLVAYRTKEDP